MTRARHNYFSIYSVTATLDWVAIMEGFVHSANESYLHGMRLFALEPFREI